jgi:hypothetical protein
MPSALVRTPEEEKDWIQSKEIIQQEYPDKEKSDPDGFYALVTTVYKSMRTVHGDERWPVKEVSEAEVSAELLSLLEMVAASHPSRAWLVAPELLASGDRFVVCSLMGKVLAEGVVHSNSPTEREVRGSMRRTATERTETAYSYDAQTFFVLEDISTRVVLEEGDDRWSPEDQESELHPVIRPLNAPETDRILKIKPSLTPYQAAILWGDIRSWGLGEAVAMWSKKHGQTFFTKEQVEALGKVA